MDDRRNLLLKNVRYNAQCQKSIDTRENYFKSCEKHGGDLAEVVKVIRDEYKAADILILEEVATLIRQEA